VHETGGAMTQEVGNDEIELEIVFKYWVQRYSSDPKGTGTVQTSAEAIITLAGLQAEDLYPDGRPKFGPLWYAEYSFLDRVQGALLHSHGHLIFWEARLNKNRSILLSTQHIFAPDDHR
jgi:hypothetical protein